jgi:hypothetical protein
MGTYCLLPYHKRRKPVAMLVGARWHVISWQWDRPTLLIRISDLSIKGGIAGCYPVCLWNKKPKFCIQGSRRFFFSISPQLQICLALNRGFFRVVCFQVFLRLPSGEVEVGNTSEPWSCIPKMLQCK